MLLSSSSRHISTLTVQRRLRELGLHGRIVAKKTLLRVVHSVKPGGGGVMRGGHCLAGDTVGDLFRIRSVLNPHDYHNTLQ